MKSLATHLGLLLLALAATSCAPLSNIAAPHDEYLHYRAVRTSHKLEPRLQASWLYLEKYPQGRWRDEVRPWFDRAEAKYWESRKDSLYGLASYLKLLPNGPHAAEAQQHHALLRRLAQAAEAEGIALNARYTEERLAARARERELARDAFTTWLGHFLSIRGWTERTTMLPSEMLFDWRMESPAARCVDDTCSKLLELHYAMPGGGEESERQLTLEPVLLLRQGMVHQAKLQGPELFSRLYEASTRTAVTPNDLSSRIRAIAYAIDVVKGATEALLPAASCEKEAVAPVVLSRACNGWTLTMTAAEDPSEDDRIVIQGPPSP